MARLDRNGEPVDGIEDADDTADGDADEDDDDTADGDDDDTGDGDGDEDGDADGDDEDDEDDPEDGDGDGESEDGDEDEDDDDTGDGDGDGDKSGRKSRAQKRIKQLNAKAKDAQRRAEALEAELEEARKLAGDDGKAILAAAEKAGVLPSMLTAEVSKGLEQLAEARAIADKLDEMLDRDEDEYKIGETTYTRRQVERLLSKQQQKVAECERRYGPARDKAIRKARAIFKLGLKARKAGWDGEDGATAGKQDRKPAKGGKPEAKAKKAAKKAKGTERPRKKVDYSSAESTDDMLALIERSL